MEGTNLNYIERTWAEINLDNMIESARIVREELLPDCKWKMCIRDSIQGGESGGKAKEAVQGQIPGA